MLNSGVAEPGEGEAGRQALRTCRALSAGRNGQEHHTPIVSPAMGCGMWPRS